MIVEDQLYRGGGRISGIEKLEEFDELPAAVAVFNERVNLAGKQINSSQQAEGAMAFVLMIPREGRVDARHGRQVRCRRCEGLDSRLLVVGDNRHRLARFLRFGGRLFQDLDLPIDTQNLRHLLLKLGVAIFQVVTHLVRLDFLVAEYLTHRALDQPGETGVPRRRSVFTRMTCQKPRRPQFVRIAVLSGLVTRQGYQPSLSLRCDRRLLARMRSVIECRQRAKSQRPLDAALDCLMMHTKALPDREERWILTIGEQHARSFNPARQLGSRARKRYQASNLLITHRQLDRVPPSCHFAAPRSANRKRGIREQPTCSITANFMESVV